MADTTLANVLLLAPELEPITENIAKISSISVVTVADATSYTVKVNTTTFTFSSGVAATAISIAAGLVALINLGSEPVTAVDNFDGTFTITADVAGTDFDLVVTSLLYITVIEANWSGTLLIAMILADVALEVRNDRYNLEEERAQRYLAAHILTKILQVKGDPSAVVGGMQREKTGDIEIWWPQNLAIQVISSGYHTTKYGEIFLSIKQRYSLRFL